MKQWLICTSLLVIAGAAIGGDTTIAVGTVLPLSGNTSNYGLEALKGINLAVEQVNARGGVKGYQVHLIVRDNQGDPTKTSQDVTDLIAIEQVMAIIGPITSTNAAAAGAVAQQNRTPLVLPVATSPYVTEIGEYICRICFTDPYQSKALAEFARKNLKSEKAAVIFEEHSAYSEQLAEFFALRFQDMDGRIVFMESFEHNPSNLPQLVDKALSQESDLLFLPVYYPEAAAAVNRVMEIGSDITLLGGDGWEAGEFFRLVSGDIKPGQIYISSHFSAQLQQENVSRFVENYQRNYDVLPNAVAALGYDASMVLADAMQRATVLTREGIQQALVSTTNFLGATGRISINEKRNAVKDVYILKALEDRFVYETMVSRF